MNRAFLKFMYGTKYSSSSSKSNQQAVNGMTENPFITFYDGVGRMRGDIPVFKLFVHTYQEIPCTADWVTEASSYYDYKTIIKILSEYRQDNAEEDYHVRVWNADKKIFYIVEQYCDLGNGVVVYMHRGEYKTELDSPNNIPSDDGSGYHNAMYCLNLFYIRSQRELADTLQQRFLEALLTLRTTSTLNMVCRDSDYYLYPFEIKKPTIDIELNYGSQFVEVHEKIIKALSTKDKQGVVLLHGLPGTGKTHYIRFLINSLKEKELIYVPPDMAYALSSPDFLPFLMKHTNAVLIIEDAENIIKDRQYQDNQAVANLLNLSDGLLGDCLNLQIIATFNSDIAKIDSALLRKGRLIAEWKFDKLELAQAQKLSQQLGFESEISEAMTLAEIYGLNEQAITPKKESTDKKKIGF